MLKPVMDRVALFAFLFFIVLFASCQHEGERIFLSHPYVFIAKGKYYMTGASTHEDGFPLLVSSNLRHWTYANNSPYILRAGPDVYGKRDFTTPHICFHNNQYILSYSANDKICVATSNTITGPYKETAHYAASDATESMRGNFLFHDDDDKWYMYHARYIQNDERNGYEIYVTEFDINTMLMKEETSCKCLEVTEPWELTLDGMEYERSSVESPQVMKRDSIYYLFYSANDEKSVDYSVGYATSKHPYGPWEKKGGAFIHRSVVGENGAGSGNFFIGLDKTAYYVYQVHQNDSTSYQTSVRIMPLKMPKHRVSGEFQFIPKKKENIIVPKIFKP